MSYHEKLPAIKEKVNELVRENPDINKVQLAYIVYECLKCCPRVHGTIKKNIMRGVLGDQVNLREVTKEKTYGGPGTFQALEITEKERDWTR